MEILVQEVGTRQENVCPLDVGMKSTPYSTPAPVQRVIPPAKAPRWMHLAIGMTLGPLRYAVKRSSASTSE